MDKHLYHTFPQMAYVHCILQGRIMDRVSQLTTQNTEKSFILSLYTFLPLFVCN